MLHLVHVASTGAAYSRANVRNRAEQIARHLCGRAYILGWLGRMWSALSGRSSSLLNLAEVEASAAIGNRFFAGRQDVPLCQIRGSQGRCNDFDLNFYPLQDHLKSRWVRVALARQLGLALPPVELVQVGDIYFVRDGHHRISVARVVGQLEINAEVRVWEIK